MSAPQNTTTQAASGPEADEQPIVKLPRGTRVRVPRGTPIAYDTADEKRRETGRAQIVTVAWMTHTPNTIYWAGSGGYWKGALLTDDLEVL